LRRLKKFPPKQGLIDRPGSAYNRAHHLEERTRMMQTWADYLDGLKG